MNTTPNANRKHITFFGSTNAGKSSLINAIIGQEISIVSSVKGTTTDPVSKPMELIPFGPVVFTDTAGLDDIGEIGKLRVEKTKKILHRTDFAVLVTTPEEILSNREFDIIPLFDKFKIPYMIVMNKIDLLENKELSELKNDSPNIYYLSTFDDLSILEFKKKLIELLKETDKESSIIGDLLPYGSVVIMVVPVDSEAPKGRLILPQVQLIRDCLDNGIKSYVVRDTELQSALEDLDYKVDLVITDSQAFKEVSEIVPKSVRLTSFSILFARHKGDIKEFIIGVDSIRKLNENSKVLISESCTHNHSHEDIGRYKIPNLMKKKLGYDFKFDFKMGHDFPNDDTLGSYDLIIHCGSCMLNQKTMESRVMLAKDLEVPITNYGVVLAYLNDILDRSIEIFI
jgi:[FeFe] hydrogenase H-cluster maturation GTPase HydF